MERLLRAAGAPAAEPPAPAEPGLEDLVTLGFDRGSAEAALAAAAGRVDIAADMLCVGLGLQITEKPHRLTGTTGKSALLCTEYRVYRNLPVILFSRPGKALKN